MRPRGETWNEDMGGCIDLIQHALQNVGGQRKRDRGGDALYDRGCWHEMVPILRHISTAAYVFTSYLSNLTYIRLNSQFLFLGHHPGPSLASYCLYNTRHPRTTSESWATFYRHCNKAFVFFE